MNEFDRLHFDDFNVYARSIEQQLYVYEKFYYHTLTIEHPKVVGNYTWCLPMPVTECFVLERVLITGLSTDTLEGKLVISDASIGRIMLDTPMIWWGLRSNRRISVPWMVRRAATLNVSLQWNQDITTGLDMFGKPRKRRSIMVILIGKAGRIIQ